MQLEDSLMTVFTATIDDVDGNPVIQIPAQELELGALSTGDTYQVALIKKPDSAGRTADRASSENQHQNSSSSEPPVSEGEHLDVEIVDVGEQGDGIARVGPGYVIFIPDADVGDRVTIVVTKTRENFGFAEVVTPEPVNG